jgi:hypothetical protein
LVLTYAEILLPIYDEEVKRSTVALRLVHLHHEDFTGQYGKFYLGLIRMYLGIEQRGGDFSN